jgi:hypothetical protein
MADGVVAESKAGHALVPARSCSMRPPVGITDGADQLTPTRVGVLGLVQLATTSGQRPTLVRRIELSPNPRTALPCTRNRTAVDIDLGNDVEDILLISTDFRMDGIGIVDQEVKKRSSGRC